MQSQFVRVTVAFLVSLFLVQMAPRAQESYDVVWNSPSADALGSLPLGNGEVVVNTWVEEGGDLLFYVGRTDSWGDNGRLMKIGRVRVRIDPSPYHDGVPFVQTLRLADATMEVRYGAGRNATVVWLWVDAFHPLVHVTVNGPAESTATVTLEPWRTQQHELESIEVSDVMLDRSQPESKHAPTVVEPDHFLTAESYRIGWYHHNAKSVGPEITAQVQGLTEFGREDPLLYRTFGGVVVGDNVRRVDDHQLVSLPAQTHHLRVYVHTEHPADPWTWLVRTDAIIAKAEEQPWEEQRARHVAKWEEFWARSWIHVFAPLAVRGQDLVPRNQHQVRIGIDQHDGNPYPGEIGRVSILGEVLSEADLAQLALHPEIAQIPARKSLLHSAPGAEISRIEGSAGWNFGSGLTVEAFVRPAADAAGGGRIVDKVTPGVDDGFLFDTHPGRGLRLITGAGVLHVEDVLPAGEWSHVAAVIDPGGGELRIYRNGELLAKRDVETFDDAFLVSRAYALQRFVDACAGKGRFPIKFNGSIFTVPHPGTPGDADYRRWGPGYWWQNTRLPYLSMCTSGDFELMQPLFRMYAEDLMPLFVHRTQRYFNHAGAFIPECIYFWGEVFSETYGWTPFEERGEDKLQSSGWHKWEWVSGPELVWMMLDYYEHTQDHAFLAKTLLPAAKELLTFFDQHYELDANGKLHMYPAQAVETWWDCTNPMPEAAGLRAVTKRLLTLPSTKTSKEERAFWTSLHAKTPPLPTHVVDGVTMLAPAERFEDKRNVENPELYAVFPFRLVSFEKPNAALGRAALAHRWDRGNFGWRQDDLFMAYLGLAADARSNLVGRARNSHEGSRFPAFWGPNYDWVPDQDHGGVLMRALQVMLMQTEGKTIHLLPAWPKDWDVEFKLHAPYRTVLEGVVRNGKVYNLKVTPPARRKDVVIHPAQ